MNNRNLQFESRSTLLGDHHNAKLQKQAARILNRAPKPPPKPARRKAEDAEEAAPILGQVIRLASGMAQVQTEGGVLNCLLSGEVARKQKTDIAVGDRVEIEAKPGSTPVVLEVLPRHSWLSRPDPHNGYMERVLVANIERVALVVSVKAPPLKPRLIDRALAAIQRGGAEPILCVNKLDLLPAEEREAELKPLADYRKIGIPVIECSAREGIGVAELRELLRGRLCALVGHSGVGKSSLLNALAPELGLRTGGLNAQTGKGRHTTTGYSLTELADGTRLVDTPGVREFGLWGMDREELEQAFPEFAEFPCRFADCSHGSEPGCGLRAAIEEGNLSEARFEAYLKMRDEVD